MKTIWRVSAYLFRYQALFFLTLGLALASTLFLIAIPQVIRLIVDEVITPGRADLLLWGVATLTACYLLRDAFNCLRIRVNNTLEQKVLIDLRADLHDKLLELPASYYDQRQSGEIASRVIEDVQSVERVLLDGTEQGSVALLTILGITTILLTQQPLLAVLVLAPLPLVLWLSALHFRAARSLWKRTREAAGDLNALLVEDISGNRLITAFGLKPRERTRFRAAAELLRERTLRAMFRWSLHGPGTSFITSLGSVAVMGVGGWLLIRSQAAGDGAFSLGDFIAFFAYCGLLYQPVSQLNQLNHLLAAGKASAERVFEVLDHPVHIVSPPDPAPFPSGLIEVRYESVRYAYPGRPALIDHLDLTLPAGKVTALVGHTGAGKSTLANLLLRQDDVASGRILLNHTDLRALSLQDLRENIGYVPQEPFLFDGTLLDNLLLARPEVTEADLIQALEAAAAWDFVQRLPQGLDTRVGERGIRLSVGEKQRLTIARVILRNPPLVILDEATASVDTLTEAAIQEAVDRLVRARTTLVIAHRLSTIRRADQVVVLSHGRIVECGPPAELLARNGPYAELWRAAGLDL